MQEAIELSLKFPEDRARLDDMQFQAVGSTPVQFEKFVQSEVNRWIGVVKATGVKVD